MDGHPSVHWHRGWEPVADAIYNLVSNAPKPQNMSVEGLGTVSAKSLQEFKAQIDGQVREALMAEQSQIFGATVHVGFKSLREAWPHARFIHLIRDPRDIAISNLKLGWAGHPFEAAETWSTAERHWDKMRKTLSNDQFIELRYEDLVAQPRAELGRVCDFLQIPFDESLFSYTQSSSYTYPKQELAQRWRGRLTDREISLIEHGLHEQMLSRGYQPASSKTNVPNVVAAAYRHLGKWKVRRMSLKEHGLKHLILRKTANVLKSKKLQERVLAAEAGRRAEHIKKLEKNY